MPRENIIAIPVPKNKNQAYEANAVYNTVEVTIPADIQDPNFYDKIVVFYVEPQTFIINEPPTTEVHFEIQADHNDGRGFVLSARSTFVGRDGVAPPEGKEIGLGVSLPAPGTTVRGRMYFTCADPENKRIFGIYGRTY